MLRNLSIHNNQETEKLLLEAYSREFDVCVWGVQ